MTGEVVFYYFDTVHKYGAVNVVLYKKSPETLELHVINVNIIFLFVGKIATRHL
jgi:hypothetical protein